MTTQKLEALLREKRALLEGASPRSKPNPRYARVFFELRRHYDLTSEACLLLDVIAILSRKTGWCFASRAYLAGLLGVSVSSVKRLLASLEAKALVERHPTHARHLRPTTRWCSARKDAEADQADRPAGSF